MKPMRTLLLSASFLLILLAAFLWLHPHMPARVPTHWNAQGQVNGYMSPIGAVATPMIIIAAVALLTLLLPAISPRHYGIKPFIATYHALMLAVQAFVLISGLGVLLNAAGHPVRMPLVSMLVVGVLLMVMGNYMGKLRKNFFIGIRSPWTLASDAVWERTHRLAAWIFVLAGIVVMAAALAGVPLRWLVIAIIGATLVPWIYSFWIYRHMEGHG